MDKRKFEETYREKLRPAFDWDAFESDAWEVRKVRLKLPRDAARVVTPWFPEGRPQPLSVAEAAANQELIGDERRTLFAHADELVDGAEIAAPAFALGDERYLILDHNHRAVAAVALERSVSLKLHVVCGPDLSLLPDFEAQLRGER
ncbi:MAG TPA: hypothetical protein VF132_04405 [Rudaea sp.]